MRSIYRAQVRGIILTTSLSRNSPNQKYLLAISRYKTSFVQMRHKITAKLIVIDRVGLR